LEESAMRVYKMVQIPPNVSLAAKSLLGRAPDPTQAAAQYLESVVNNMAREGWHFERVDEIGVQTSPGCLLRLFGASTTTQIYYVITFSKEQ
jgi:hypothetical protein